MTRTDVYVVKMKGDKSRNKTFEVGQLVKRKGAWRTFEIIRIWSNGVACLRADDRHYAWMDGYYSLTDFVP